MRNRYGLRALIVMVLLALGCKMGLAQIGPRYVIDLPGSPAGAPASLQGRIQLAGKGLVMIHFQGLDLLTVDADADAYSAEAVRSWPAADLLLVTPPSAGRYGGLAPLASLRGMPVVMAESGIDAAVAMPWPAAAYAPHYYPMQVWDVLNLRKGKTQLRVTAMPGQAGTLHVAGFMLEVGSRRASYRIYISCEQPGMDAADELARRLPGADLALLPGRDAPQLLMLQHPNPMPRSSAPSAVLAAAGYTFMAVKR